MQKMAKSASAITHTSSLSMMGQLSEKVYLQNNTTPGREGDIFAQNRQKFMTVFFGALVRKTISCLS